MTDQNIRTYYDDPEVTKDERMAKQKARVQTNRNIRDAERKIEKEKRDEALQHHKERREQNAAIRDAEKQRVKDEAFKSQMEVWRIQDKQRAEDEKWEKERIAAEKAKKDAKMTPVKAVKKVGNIIASGTKSYMAEPSSRSGKRATKEWRRENREFVSEARKYKHDVKSVGSFNSNLMFGVDKTPVRTRHKGMEQYSGAVDPLSNWTTGMLGQRVQSQEIEGMGRRMVRTDYPDRPQTNQLNEFVGKTLVGSVGKRKRGERSALDDFARKLL